MANLLAVKNTMSSEAHKFGMLKACHSNFYNKIDIAELCWQWHDCCSFGVYAELCSLSAFSFFIKSQNLKLWSLENVLFYKERRYFVFGMHETTQQLYRTIFTKISIHAALKKFLICLSLKVICKTFRFSRISTFHRFRHARLWHIFWIKSEFEANENSIWFD